MKKHHFLLTSLLIVILLAGGLIYRNDNIKVLDSMGKSGLHWTSGSQRPFPVH